MMAFDDQDQSYGIEESLSDDENISEEYYDEMEDQMMMQNNLNF